MPGYRPSQAPDDRPARIGRRAVREIAREAQRVQRSIPIYGDPRGKGQTTYGFGGIVLFPAVVTQAITACTSGSSPAPGNGRAQLWSYDDDGGSLAQNPDGDDGTSAVSGGVVTVLNWYVNAGTIAAGKHIWVASFGNAYWLFAGDC